MGNLDLDGKYVRHLSCNGQRVQQTVRKWKRRQKPAVFWSGGVYCGLVSMRRS